MPASRKSDYIILGVLGALCVLVLAVFAGANWLEGRDRDTWFGTRSSGIR